MSVTDATPHFYTPGPPLRGRGSGGNSCRRDWRGWATDRAVVRTSDVDYRQSGALGTPPGTDGLAGDLAGGPDGGTDGGAQPGQPATPAPGGWLDATVIFRQHHADLVRLALLLLGDRACAEDVVQDVFTRLCAGRRKLARDSAVAYVRTAVVNGCRSVQRRRALARRVALTRAVPWSDMQESAEHTAILAEDRRQVLSALAALPRRRREVLVLRYYLDLPVREVAGILGISEGSVKSAAARGLAALARELGEER